MLPLPPCRVQSVRARSGRLGPRILPAPAHRCQGGQHRSDAGGLTPLHLRDIRYVPAARGRPHAWSPRLSWVATCAAVATLTAMGAAVFGSATAGPHARPTYSAAALR